MFSKLRLKSPKESKNAEKKVERMSSEKNTGGILKSSESKFIQLNSYESAKDLPRKSICECQRRQCLTMENKNLIEKVKNLTKELVENEKLL